MFKHHLGFRVLLSFVVLSLLVSRNVAVSAQGEGSRKKNMVELCPTWTMWSLRYS